MAVTKLGLSFLFYKIDEITSNNELILWVDIDGVVCQIDDKPMRANQIDSKYASQWCTVVCNPKLIGLLLITNWQLA